MKRMGLWSIQAKIDLKKIDGKRQVTKNSTAGSISWLDENKIPVLKNGKNNSSISQIVILDSKTENVEIWTVINGNKEV